MSESKFKVGDKVRVKSDLVLWKAYGGDTFVDGMNHLRGKTVTIKTVLENGKYRIGEESYSWTNEMLEPVHKFNVGDIVFNVDSADQMRVVAYGSTGKVITEDLYDGTYDADAYNEDELELAKSEEDLDKLTNKELIEKVKTLLNQIKEGTK